MRRTNWRGIAGLLGLYIFLVSFFALSAFSEPEPDALSLVFPAIWACIGLVAVASRIRQDRLRWLHVLGEVLGEGICLSFGLVGVLMGVGLLALPKTDADPRLLAVICGLCGGFGLGSIAAPTRAARGTTLREGGLEMGGSVVPWDRFKTYRWLDDELGCDLILIGQDPGRVLGGIPITRRIELLVPVPAAEKAAVDAFLAQRIGRAPESLASLPQDGGTVED
jgi:hypothetical protein